MLRFLIVILILIAGFSTVFFFLKSFSSPQSPQANVSITPRMTPFPSMRVSRALKISTDWQSIGTGVQIRKIPYQYNGVSYGFQVIKVDPKQFQLRLAYDQKGQTIRSWAKDVEGIVINSGFFKEGNESVGLLYIDGKRLDDHRIRPAGTGLLVIKPQGIDIMDLKNEAIPDEEELMNAVQTFPVLISNGQVVADTSLTSEDRRTAIGKDVQGNIYLITAEFAHLGLYNFAKAVHDSGLQLTEVLNLDGGGSTGISVQTDTFQQFIDSETLVPTVLIVEKKN